MAIEFHPHARERMAERGATEQEVIAAVEKGERFGMFAADLLKYPVLVELELVEQSPELRRQIVKIKHPGGRIAIPYVVREDARVILLINGTEWNP